MDPASLAVAVEARPAVPTDSSPRTWPSGRLPACDSIFPRPQRNSLNVQHSRHVIHRSESSVERGQNAVARGGKVNVILRERSSRRTAFPATTRGGEIDPRTLAYGIIQSGELGPMFFNALGTTKQDVLAALGAG